MARVTFKGKGSLGRVAHSDHIAEQLEAVAERILQAARQDPNEYYVSTLRMQRFHSAGRLDRVSVQVGAQPGKGGTPGIGGRVEAKRGTLARAMGAAGL